MNCCTMRSCGMCGRCDDGLREGDEPHAPMACDICGTTLGPNGNITIGGVGAFCSYEHANQGMEEHAAQMLKRWQKASA